VTAEMSSPGPGPRERMVRSAMALISTQGVSGTGLREVVGHAGAPRGSLQHYFPQGKEQLVREALALAGRTAAGSVERVRAHGPAFRPSDVLAAMVTPWRRWLTDSEFALGCPAVATMADVGAATPSVRRAVEEVFAIWEGAVEAALRDAGLPPAQAAAWGTVLLSALEGAIVLSRARHSLAPLDAVRAELSPVLDAQVAPPG
jgi:AcrR family transcriptional regulator